MFGRLESTSHSRLHCFGDPRIAHLHHSRMTCRCIRIIRFDLVICCEAGQDILNFRRKRASSLDVPEAQFARQAAKFDSI